MEKGNYDDTGKKKNCPTCRPKKNVSEDSTF